MTGNRRLIHATVALALMAGAAGMSRAAERPALATPAIEAEIDRLLAAMTLEQKVAQTIMPDIAAITPADVAEHRFGAILNGGNSSPGGNERAPVAAWLALADAFWDASTGPRADGGPAIPTLWATDAVHGHNNVVGATLFPHNIGLGAAGDAALVRAIGQATAREIAATGIDWTFAPTLAIARNDRWGRTYESYSEDPAVVVRLGRAMVEGLQGVPGTPGFLRGDSVLATAKHFVADGGTEGVDQGDVRGDVAAILALHGAPYPAAIDAGVQTAMASFSSINGDKMHGSKALLTGVLKGDMGFDGLVVGDWNGHGQLPGCTNARCPATINAGLDMFMVPEDWKALKANTIADVRAGAIPMARLDDAVRRILRVKLRYDAWAKGRPSTRDAARRPDLLGHPDHRALAREAVAKSLVLLKNNGGVLPIRRGARVLVAGDAADSMAMQAGGWSISWQGGGDLANGDFPGGTTIWAGLDAAIRAGGGTATLSPDGRFSAARPDVAIVVFGEKPYAEFSGDLPSLAFADDAPLALMKQLKAAGVPVVALFLSGRPMWVNRELNAADAFVAAWLPGSEGGGVADVLVEGAAVRDFRGRLPFSWPARATDSPNAGDTAVVPLFPLGFGLGYAAPATLAPLGEESGIRAGSGATAAIMRAGRAIAPNTALLVDKAGAEHPVLAPRAATPDGALDLRARDRAAQEDARQLTWTAPAAFRLRGPIPAALADAAPGMALVIQYDVTRRPAGPVQLAVACGPACRATLDVAAGLVIAEGKGWRTARIALSCFVRAAGAAAPDAPILSLSTSAALAIGLSDIALVPANGEERCTL